MGMLDNGITTQGVVSRIMDKFGKRMFSATPKKDMSLKDGKISVRSGNPPMPVGSDGKRTDVGIH